MLGLKARIQYTRQLLSWYYRAVTIYDVHQPFLYRFVSEVLEDPRHFYPFGEIETKRRFLLQSTNTIQVTDHGAGSLVQNTRKRKITHIARSSAVSPFFGRVLFKTAILAQAQHMLELGTSLGISTLYLAGSSRKSQVYTLEGCPETAKLAARNLKNWLDRRVFLTEGTFGERLPEVLGKMPKIDLAFIDGNHQKAATLQYFEACLPKTHPHSVLIFDDIHWSKEMTEAWEEIRRHPQVRLSVDLFYSGLVFFREEIREPQHVSLIRQRFKPWHLGFFARNSPSK